MFLGVPSEVIIYFGDALICENIAVKYLKYPVALSKNTKICKLMYFCILHFIFYSFL